MLPLFCFRASGMIKGVVPLMSGSVSFFSIMLLIKINMFVANMRFNIIRVSNEVRCSDGFNMVNCR